MMKHKALRGRIPLLGLVLAVLALVLLALACEEEEEEATPTPAVTETPTAATPTPTALKPGAAGIPSNPREVRGLEGIITLDDGLAIWKERPADEDRTGVTADTIKLGRTAGITGWLAVYEPGWGPINEALIKRVNEAGGIHGRKIELITRDDRSDPSVAVEVTKELVEGDKVFALYNTVGSPVHAAVHDYHVAKKVPYLFNYDGSDMGMEPVTSKWDFTLQGSDFAGGMAMAEGMAKAQPGCKTAIVYSTHQASVAGRDGIRYQAPKAGLEIVGEFAHDVTAVDLTPQAHQVAESGAECVIIHSTYTAVLPFVKALHETVGWQGKISQWGFVTGDPGAEEVMDGTYSAIIDLKDIPGKSPVWEKLVALGEEEGVPIYGALAPSQLMAFEHLVRALELAGPDLTREGLIEALETGFDGTWECAACRAPTFYGPQDHWMVETWYMTRWDNATKSWEILGTVDYETSKGLGLRGNVPGYECQPPSAEYPEGTCPWKEGS